MISSKPTASRHFLRQLSGFWILACFASMSAFFSAQAQPQTAQPQPQASKKRAAPLQSKKTKASVTSESPPSSELGTISSIEVQGNKRIEKDAVLARIKSKVGGGLSRSLIREDIQSIFKTGFFYDVRASREGSKLTFGVVEKPSISEIIFAGNEELKTEELLEASGLKAFEILSQNKIREAVEKLQKMYEDKGYFLARIDPKTEDVTANETVKLTFTIKENDKVKVKKITFLGNTKLKDGYLKDRMGTGESGYFSFLSGSGSYKQDVFERDTQFLRLIYFNEGYVQVKIDRPQVYVTPDKKNIYVTIRIEEGEQYDVGEIDFSGDILFPRQELSEAIELNKRTIFSYEVLQKDLSNLQAKYGDLGYAFANVIPRTRINEKDRKVDITFEFDKGNKVYFGQINVVGNSKTRDKVVRRELKIREGELYNETRRRESLEKIQRLGFFDEVVFKTSTPPEKPDQLNVDISVKERNTGSIQLGAGYGSATGFNLNGQVNQSNFLGKGQKLGAGLNISGDSSTYNLNFTEPYFKDTEWSVGFDVYQSSNSRADFGEKKIGGAVRVGHPLSEDLFASLRYKLDRTTFEETYDSAGNLFTDKSLFPLDTADGNTSSITGILEYDQRNDRFSPSKGIYASTSLEYAGLGGDLHYTKGNGTFRYFKKLFWEVVWRNNLSYSWISSHNADTEAPFNELYLLGGPYSLRGYRFFKIGKTRRSDKIFNFENSKTPPNPRAEELATRPYGGTKQLLYQMEFEFPMIAEAGIKGVTFFDVGQAEDEITNDNFFANAGFGFRWFSPIGPLRFEWGFPFRQTELSPDSVVFEFSIGSPF